MAAEENPPVAAQPEVDRLRKVHKAQGTREPLALRPLAGARAAYHEGYKRPSLRRSPLRCAGSASQTRPLAMAAARERRGSADCQAGRQA
eukprot:CAMPEP_0170634050 /NCGR_PEP_ID=MMETSP0224-20130122/36362_1 /TAXON_ID=285029 /ORGANISM="Togula jolla, Strain CCCM 725" /LENGTH=89 /DNA_ID=CAMNT_0010963219 /DNA_START=409 /DNA_END=680 /DNA_ORIENTATION=-